MPYRLSANGLCVEQQKPDGWHMLKCYDDKADARAYLGALQANVEDAKAMEQTEKSYYPEKLTQAETNYESYMVRRNPVAQACANCRWFTAPMGCYLVEDEPLPILPTGWCDRWEAMPKEAEEPMEMEMEMEAPEMDMGMMSRKPSLVDRLKAMLPKRPDEPFTTFKALGNRKWFAVFSNNFLDRDGEIITQKAWERYVGRVQSGFSPMPELWLAHIPGTKHGQAQWVGKAGHMIWAAGEFDDTPGGRAAEKYYRGRKGDITMSHAFMYPTWAKKRDGLPDGVKAAYEDLSVFEITTLEPGEESNPFTDFKTLEELEAMPISDKERERIKAVFGQAADTVLANAETAEKAGEIFREIGTAYKSYVDTTEPVESGKKEAGDTIGAELLSDVLMAQGDVAQAMKGIEGFTKSELTAIRAEMKQYAAAVAEMRKLMEMDAQPASESASTIVDIPTGDSVDIKKLEDALNALKAAQAIKDKASPAQEFDPFFGDLQVKKR